jgi:signal transduction histidine kinase
MGDARPRILIVGPESERQTQAREVLAAAGCTVDQMACAKDLLAATASGFDVVLADFNAIDLPNVAAAIASIKSAESSSSSAKQPPARTPESLRKLAHDLRTPLNAILGWAQLLKFGDLDDAMKQEALDTIERSAKAQADLISKMLDVPLGD